jgi:hypothetical protein
MIYDYSFKTGINFSGLYSPKKEENIGADYVGGLFLDSTLISGRNNTILSFNGQTLAEQNLTKIEAGFGYAYLNSGDYYFDTGESYRSVFFDETLTPETSVGKDFFYSIKKDLREIPVSAGSSSGQMQSGLNTLIIDKFPDRTGLITGLTSFDFFLNGQKIYDGGSGSYEVNSSQSGFVYKEQITGKIFAIPKKEDIKNITGVFPDIYGQDFVETTVIAYKNGLISNKINWVELYTGVTTVATGIDAIIFENYIEQESITL